jgi:hypothetical protein
MRGVAHPEAHDTDVIQSGHPDPGSFASPYRWLGTVLTVVVALAGAAAYGWNAWTEAAEDRERSGQVSMEVEAPLPFSADSGAAEGILRLRNNGPLALSVLTLGLRPVGLRLVTENLPLWIAPGRDRLLVVRIEMDCTADRNQTTARSVLLRARTVDGRERIRSVPLQVLPSVLAGARRQVCDPPVLPLAERLTLAYAGITDVADGHITTRLLAVNDRDVPVTIAGISAISGWPVLDRARSSRLPMTVPAHGRLPLDLAWDVSRCLRSESGRFSSGLHLRLGPLARTEELAVLEPGIDYTRDFFRRYSEVCP